MASIGLHSVRAPHARPPLSFEEAERMSEILADVRLAIRAEKLKDTPIGLARAA